MMKILKNNKINGKKLKKCFSALAVVFIASVILIITLYLSIVKISKAYVYNNVSDIPKTQVALVLGAKVYADGGLSPMTQDRSDAAVDLYKSGKVERILVSGDHGTKDYDEVNTIMNYLIKKGISSNVIFLDHAGFNTYNSLYRAKAIFNVESMTIVTQGFHLPRAMYIAHSLNEKAYGLKANRQNYGNTTMNYAREIPADVKAFLELSFQIKPKFLGDQIPITGDSTKSWD